MGTQIAVFKETHSEQCANIHGLLPKQYSEKSSFVAGSAGTVTEESIGGSRKPTYSRILRPLIHKTETKRQMENNNRPVRSKRVHILPSIPNGNSEESSELNEKRNEKHKNRSQRCLLSCVDAPQLQEVYESGSIRKSVPIQSYADGAKYLSSNLYQSVSGGGEICQVQRYPYTCVSGRLENKRLRSDSGSSSRSISGRSVQVSGVVGKHRQVHVNPKPRLPVCGNTLQTGLGFSSGPYRQVGKPGEDDQRVVEERRRDSQNLVQYHRQDGQYDRTGQDGSTAQETSAVDSTEQLESVQRQLGKVYRATRVVGASSGMVAGQREHSKGSSFGAIPAQTESVHRCQSMGIRGNSGEPVVVWTVEQGGSRASLKQQGNVSHLESSGTLPRCDKKLITTDMLRQHHHCSNYKQAGGYQVMEHDPDDLEPVEQTRCPERCDKGVPVPGAWAINAKTFNWTGLFVYALPPCKIRGEALMKLEEDQAEKILVALLANQGIVSTPARPTDSISSTTESGRGTEAGSVNYQGIYECYQ